MLLSEDILIESIPKLKKYSRVLFYKNYSMADDLVGDTLLRAVSKQHLLREDNNPYLWLKGIMYSVFCNTLKSSCILYTDTLNTFVYPSIEEEIYLKEIDKNIHDWPERVKQKNLSEEDILEIKSLINKKVSYRKIADFYKISLGNISKIANGKVHAHIN